MVDSITLIECPANKLMKLVTADGKSNSYQVYPYFNLHRGDVTDLDSLYNLLDGLQYAEHFAVVPGDIADPALTKNVRRATRTSVHGPQTLKDGPHSWLVIDADDLPCPASLDLTDLISCARSAVETGLPSEFKGVKCVVQATTKHGLKPGLLRLRLWFWLDQPLTLAEKHQWLGRCPIDQRFFLAGQIVYCAIPEFRGLNNPLKSRLALLRGRPVVKTPAKETIQPPPAAVRTTYAPGETMVDDRAIQAVVSRALAIVAKAPEGQKHNTLIKMARWLGGMVEAQFNHEELAQKLVKALPASAVDLDHAYRNALSSLAYGEQEPIPVPRDITGLGPIEPTPENPGDQTIPRLAGLSAFDYDRQRDAAAKQLGIRVGTLDAEVDRYRKEQEAKVSNRVANAISGIEPLMTEFNEKHWFVNDSGNAVIYTPIQDDTVNRVRYDKLSVKAFKENYLNRFVLAGEAGQLPAADVWLKHENRRQYLGGVVFDPSGTKVRANQFNLWRGLAVAPKPGNWNRLKAHIHQNVCQGIDAHCEWLMDWMARMVQIPGEPGLVAVVMRGKEGVGKGFLATALCRLLGQHSMHISNPKLLIGQFNAHLEDCVFLFADEAFYAGDKAHVSILNTLITEKTIVIEDKYRKAIQRRNFLHLMMSSNEDWVVPARSEARRYLVLDVADTHRGDKKYFGDMAAEMENGGYAAMLHDLLNRDISRFDHRTAPDTKGLRDQKKLSFDPLHNWWLDCLYRGAILPMALDQDWPEFETTDALYSSYALYMEERRNSRLVIREKLGKFLAGLGIRHGRSRKHNMKCGYKLDNLDIMRQEFCQKTGVEVDWSSSKTPEID